MSLPVRVTPEAESQIREIENWWRLNRPAAPDLFLTELAACFEIISQTPHIGKVYRAWPLRLVRRLLLKGTRHHVYYAPTDSDVVVLAVWHAQRGADPPLR